MLTATTSLDYLTAPDAWASRVLAVAGSQFEGELFIAAVGDYREHVRQAALRGGTLPPRSKYIADHVAGQIDRAREIVG